MAPLCISFSGVDGAGKSTQIQALCSRMIEGRLRVRLIGFWDEVACFTSLRENTGHRIFKGDKGVGSPERPIRRRDKNVRSWPVTLARLFFYLLDAASLRRVTMRVQRNEDGVVIFDRYIYDELANLPLRNPLICLYVRLVMLVVPRPDVSFVLDADPAEARARKPEYPLDFIRINRQSYLDLSAFLGGMTVIPPLPIDEAERAVRRCIPPRAAPLAEGSAPVVP